MTCSCLFRSTQEPAWGVWLWQQDTAEIRDDTLHFHIYLLCVCVCIHDVCVCGGGVSLCHSMEARGQFTVSGCLLPP